jgi:hypothetical protein
MTIGEKIVWGVRELKPITGMAGKYRLRMRNTKPVELFERTEGGVKKWLLKDCGDHWEPIFTKGVNHTITTP